MRSLRLFGLRRENSSIAEIGKDFTDLMVARKERDRLTIINKVQYVVCPGPDHKKYKQWQEEMKRMNEEIA